ncbi:MAG TPA: hypothetical protein VKO43_03450 [Candidatus Krumholzibacteriaceae bacterium]|nr:hypothetical protein [Candidatus Krumholzibacteriaceae bacterium]
MTVFTHFAAGALIGYFSPGVLSASIGGLLSHVLLDVIPHYDFESLKLEIFLGVVVLLILVFTGSCSLVICLGGIFAVIPDLENLLWKLGKLREDQKVFPGHAGIIPHGRKTGRKTVLIQAIFVMAVLFFLIWSV